MPMGGPKLLNMKWEGRETRPSDKAGMPNQKPTINPREGDTLASNLLGSIFQKHFRTSRKPLKLQQDGSPATMAHNSAQPASVTNKGRSETY